MKDKNLIKQVKNQMVHYAGTRVVINRTSWLRATDGAEIKDEKTEKQNIAKAKKALNKQNGNS
jgi:hypothetical protein